VIKWNVWITHPSGCKVLANLRPMIKPTAANLAWRWLEAGYAVEMTPERVEEVSA
jgi:hypothetical protein